VHAHPPPFIISTSTSNVVVYAPAEPVVMSDQLISNGGKFKLVFAERDMKQAMIDFRGISANWFKNQLCPSIRFSRLHALRGQVRSPFLLLYPYTVHIVVRTVCQKQCNVVIFCYSWQQNPAV